MDVPDKLIGLDLFSGIGGITVALAPWVRPVAYCDNDRYVTAVLLSRMADGSIPVAPIWDDVTTLKGSMLPPIDIIYGGFPCQDISVAGRGAGLEGKRSGLFFEICRLVDEIRPRFIFLENVPAITVRGLDRVIGELSALRYDCRWTVVSAAEVGANHLRKRWFCLGYSQLSRCSGESWRGTGEVTQNRHRQLEEDVAHTGLFRPPFSQEQTAGVEQCSQNVADSNGTGFRERRGSESGEPEHDTAQCGSEDDRNSNGGDGNKGPLEEMARGENPESTRICCDVPNASRQRLQRQRDITGRVGTQLDNPCDSGWWAVEPNVGRVAHGVQNRVDRLRSLGNAVVPLQAREAFKRLISLSGNETDFVGKTLHTSHLIPQIWGSA